MKKLFFTLLILLFALPVYAQQCSEDTPCPEVARLSPAMLGSVPVAACSPPTGSLLRESFEADPADNTWTTAGVGVTVTYAHALQAGSPTGSCTNGVSIVETTADTRQRIYWDKGSTLATSNSYDVEFSIYFNAWTIDNFDGTYIITWASNNDGDAYSYRIAVARSDGGGGYYFHQYGADTSTRTYGVALNTWYTIKVHVDATAASSYVQVTGGGLTQCDAASECTFTRSDVAGQYLMFGKNKGGSQAASFEIGYVVMNQP